MQISVQDDPIVVETVVTLIGGTPFATVIINVWDGEGHTDTVPITLDENGQGSGEWQVPAEWGVVAHFQGEGTNEVTRGVDRS